MSETRSPMQQAKSRITAIAQASPDIMKGFAAMSRTAMRQGVLGSGEKELMAVVAAVVKGCDDCIVYHVDAAKRHGVGEDALIEALEVAIEMGGGPAIMYGGMALEAYRGLN